MDRVSQRLIENDLAPPARTVVIYGPGWHLDPHHLLQTHRLGTELEIVVFGPVPAPVLVLDRVGAPGVSIGLELHYVAYATDAELLAPHGKGCFYADAITFVLVELMNPFVDPTSAQRVDVLIEGGLDVNQGALPGAIAVVLKR